jgi:acetyl-CoA acetyltransferase
MPEAVIIDAIRTPIGRAMMGAASGIGEQGYSVGRSAALLAGLDHHVPGCTLNRFCASLLMTIRMASHAIKAGEGDQYIAAGVEAVSRAGLGARMMEEAKNPVLDGSPGSLYDVYIPIGMTAENVAERCQVTRRQRGAGQEPRVATEGEDHCLHGRGDPAGDHGPGADPGDPGAAQGDRDDDGGHRHRRDQ